MVLVEGIVPGFWAQSGFVQFGFLGSGMNGIAR